MLKYFYTFKDPFSLSASCLGSSTHPLESSRCLHSGKLPYLSQVSTACSMSHPLRSLPLSSSYKRNLEKELMVKLISMQVRQEEMNCIQKLCLQSQARVADVWPYFVILRGKGYGHHPKGRSERENCSGCGKNSTEIHLIHKCLSLPCCVKFRVCSQMTSKYLLSSLSN